MRTADVTKRFIATTSSS